MEAVAGRRGEETGVVVEDRGGEVGRRGAAEGHSLERGGVAAEVSPAVAAAGDEHTQVEVCGEVREAAGERL